jgi:hypothetical protein
VTAITWQDEAGTVYGGTLDVTRGKLTVTWGSVDMGSLTWLKQPTEDTNVNVFRGGIPNRKYGTTAEIGFPAKISIYNYTMNATLSPLMNRLGNFECGGQTTNSFFMIRDDRYDTEEGFKTAMDGVYMYYELETPRTIQLTPTQISAIVGTNNVFTDTNGDTSLEYYTKRGEQTVRIAEGVAVDVINNKNIDNLTTTNKTLVGAVNEVNTKYTNLGFTRIARGTANMESTTKAITLTGFTSTPTIVLTPLAYYKNVWITGVTSAGFTINMDTTGAFVNWIAIGN